MRRDFFNVHFDRHRTPSKPYATQHGRGGDRENDLARMNGVFKDRGTNEDPACAVCFHAKGRPSKICNREGKEDGRDWATRWRIRARNGCRRIQASWCVVEESDRQVVADILSSEFDHGSLPARSASGNESTSSDDAVAGILFATGERFGVE